MDYRTLIADDHDQLAQQKLRAIEVEHARLALDLRIAAKAGITEGDQITALRANLAGLERQHVELVDEMEPVPVPRSADNGDNGSSARRPDALASLPARS